MADDLRAAAAALDVAAADLADLARRLDVMLPVGAWRGPAAQHWYDERKDRAYDLRRAAEAVRNRSVALVARAILLESSTTPVTSPALVA